MAVNVLKEGEWGTYRHLLMCENKLVETEHCKAVNNKGDLSSLTWTEGQLSLSSGGDKLVNIYYASLNFKDVMLASGRISPETFTKDRTRHDKLLGMEFSGRMQK